MIRKTSHRAYEKERRRKEVKLKKKAEGSRERGKKKKKQSTRKKTAQTATSHNHSDEGVAIFNQDADNIKWENALFLRPRQAFWQTGAILNTLFKIYNFVQIN